MAGTQVLELKGAGGAFHGTQGGVLHHRPGPEVGPHVSSWEGLVCMMGRQPGEGAQSVCLFLCSGSTGVWDGVCRGVCTSCITLQSRSVVVDSGAEGEQ